MIKKVALGVAATGIALCAAVPDSFGQTSWTISSPDSSLQATVRLANLTGTADYPNATRLYYAVSMGSPTPTEVVPASPMGIVRSDRNFVDGLTFVSESPQTSEDSTYTMLTGKCSLCQNHYNEKTLSFQTTTGGSKLDIVLRAYNDGFAFRYRFPETNTASFSVTSEESGIALSAGTTAWMMVHDSYTTYTPAYEGYWTNNIATGTLSSAVMTAATPVGWDMPALFKTSAGPYVLFFETDLTENFAAMHLREPSNSVYRLALPLAAEGAGKGAVNPTWTLPWTMPWRVVVVGATPATILETNLSTALATPSTIADVSWIKPGRSSWSWLVNGTTNDYPTYTSFIDLAQKMNWEYSLLDGGWPGTGNGGTWQDVLKYAAAHNVSATVWYDSGVRNGADKMIDATTRATELSTMSGLGLKGIKVDFFQSDKQNVIKYYLDILKDAAANHLVVDFHGCTIPRGWQRTYPNLLTAEAVRGEEYYKSDNNYPAGQSLRNTIIPFTRNTVASMDYTPTVFSATSRPHTNTHGQELALSVVFESGIQHFGDRVTGYSSPSISTGVQTFLSQVPVAWDETKYLLGTPGTYVVLARRKGNDWYVGGVNGQATAQDVTVTLGFLASGASYAVSLIADGTSNTTFAESTNTVTAAGSFPVSMRANGGFVARLASSGGGTGGTGGQSGVGGTLGAGGSGGSTTSTRGTGGNGGGGGLVATGGASVGTGGSLASEGSAGLGGSAGSGGRGGSSASGGAGATGAAGGVQAIGGIVASASGGVVAVGGITTTGGSANSGGQSSTGGSAPGTQSASGGAGESPPVKAGAAGCSCTMGGKTSASNEALLASLVFVALWFRRRYHST
jgi:alpha-glucosidase